MKGRPGSGGPVGVRWPGGRKSALRLELRGLRPRGLGRAAGQSERRTDDR
jgi:hypothetical protein